MRLQGINDFVLLELEDRAGGNSKGGVVNGITCPLGAHYLPVPSEQAPQAADLRNLLEELGVRQRVSGRWQYDERYLCHSPQERLFFNGAWQDGLLPTAGCERSHTRAIPPIRQIGGRRQKTQQLVNSSLKFDSSQRRYCLNSYYFYSVFGSKRFDRPAPALVFRLLLPRRLRRRHRHCVRLGRHALLRQPSRLSCAWRRISERDGVLTWPEGNGWITQRMALPLGERLLTKRIVTRIEDMKHGVEVDVFDAQTHNSKPSAGRPSAASSPCQCLWQLGLLKIHPRCFKPPPNKPVTRPWLVANIHIDKPLLDQGGAAPSWDNVLYGAAGLGYVNAKHQSLEPVPAATVLTYYRALGDVKDGRKQLLERSWSSWRDEILAELSTAHPDLLAKTSRIDITRYGHAMAIPIPISPLI